MPTALLVPDTALLVPGVSGRTEVLAATREAVLRGAGDLVSGSPERVVVLAPGRAARTAPAAMLCTSLRPLGVPEAALGWPAPCRLAGCPEHLDRADAAGALTPVPRASAIAATGTAVALRLLAAVGWAGRADVVEVSGSGQGEAGPLVDDDALLVVGSLSARRADDSPRAADPRAVETDRQLLADLASPSAAGLARLADFESQIARELDISGAEPWRGLARAVGWSTGLDGGAPSGRALSEEHALGMVYLVARWDWATGKRP